MASVPSSSGSRPLQWPSRMVSRCSAAAVESWRRRAHHGARAVRAWIWCRILVAYAQGGRRSRSGSDWDVLSEEPVLGLLQIGVEFRCVAAGTALVNVAAQPVGEQRDRRE